MSAGIASVQGLGEPIRGPSALGGSFRRFMHLTWTLAVLEFKLKFFGSVLGYLWQLMKPLMLFGVLYVVFTEFVRIGGGIKFYPVVLLAGIVIYTFYAEATSMAVGSVVDRENLVRKIQFPRMVIPLSVVLTTYLNFLLNFAAVFIFMIASGVELRIAWLEIVPLVLFLGLFSTGLAMFLSASFVRFRDFRPIWDVVLPVTFYGTPILYPLESVPNAQVQHIPDVQPARRGHTGDAARPDRSRCAERRRGHRRDLAPGDTDTHRRGRLRDRVLGVRSRGAPDRRRSSS